jgi:hypothetical protein
VTPAYSFVPSPDNVELGSPFLSPEDGIFLWNWNFHKVTCIRHSRQENRYWQSRTKRVDVTATVFIHTPPQKKKEREREYIIPSKLIYSSKILYPVNNMLLRFFILEVIRS